jgi:hypothetical protein
LDNYATHKTPEIQRWLLRHPRFVLHFTPTGGSWLNLVERWFAALTTKKLQRSSHRSVRELSEADLGTSDVRHDASPSSVRRGPWCHSPARFFARGLPSHRVRA